jgi:hypothetical protein
MRGRIVCGAEQVVSATGKCRGCDRLWQGQQQGGDQKERSEGNMELKNTHRAWASDPLLLHNRTADARLDPQYTICKHPAVSPHYTWDSMSPAGGCLTLHSLRVVSGGPFARAGGWWRTGWGQQGHGPALHSRR